MMMGTDQLMIWMIESAWRAGVLTLVAALALAVLRTRNAEVRSSILTAALAASLLMPAALLLVPPVFVREAADPAEIEAVAPGSALGVVDAATAADLTPAPLDWMQAAGSAYLIVMLLLIVRLALGYVCGWHLRKRSEALAGMAPFGNVREASGLSTPAAFGWLRPVILLPVEWRAWEPRKLEAVLRHESAHIARADFLWQTLATVHTAVFWFSPLAWWLRRELACLAEQASDDRVLAEMGDSVFYAEVLFSFAGRSPSLPLAVVPMARAGSATGQRIERVLDERRTLARAFGWAGRATLAVLTGAALYLASAVSFAQAPPAPRPVPAPPVAPLPPIPPIPVAVPGTPAPPLPPPVRITPRRDEESIEVSDTQVEYRRAGKRYRITDPDLLRQVRQLQKEQAELGRQQAALGVEQAALGQKQAASGRRHHQASADTAKIEAELDAKLDQLRSRRRKGEDLGALQARLAEAQAQIAQLQERAGQREREAAELEAEFGARQARLGERQAELAERHAREAERTHRQLRRLIEEAIRDGRAQQVN